jgi:LysM repeat protein
MHAWTKSACVVLAWSVLSIILMTAGMKGSVHPAQANTRTIRSTEVILTSTSTFSVAAAPMTAASSPARYVVQPGDSLAAIAARFTVRGGWPALYAANQRRIGPDPDAIRPGTVLVLPGVRTPVRYTVAAGDTLAGIAAALSVRGGWPALYAANQRRIGPDPDAIRPGTVLAIPQRAAPPPPRPAPAPRQYHTPPPPAPAGSGHRPGPAGKAMPGAGMPQWLKIMLLAAGLLTGTAFLTELLLAVRRRRQPATRPGTPGAGKTHIVLADHDRLIVTRSQPDDMVYVLRPPGTDPKAILRTARLVLPEDLYRELAAQLGMRASWPIILADHDRLVVTRSIGDDTICVLRPPGADPMEILRVARLVLPEDPYGELADQLGVPAGLPME